jgi:hypothetical protein
MAGAHQRGTAQGGGQMRDRLVNDATRVPGRTVLIALLFAAAGTGAAAQDPHPVHYTYADGTKLQATTRKKEPP